MIPVDARPRVGLDIHSALAAHLAWTASFTFCDIQRFWRDRS
jgi:hypothetical protein